MEDCLEDALSSLLTIYLRRYKTKKHTLFKRGDNMPAKKNKVFAAIDVGSYEICMKIFELSAKWGMKEIDCLRHKVELGTQTYRTGKVDNSSVGELIKVLKDFSQVMNTYKVDDYVAYGTSAIREMKNSRIILNQIKVKTGIEIQQISNAEQRFLDYKSVAAKMGDFLEDMDADTVIVDIGGGSIQISLFENNTLVTTQNLKLGVLRLWESLRVLNAKSSAFEELIGELCVNQLQVFKKLYLKEKLIPNLIIVDDYLSPVLQKELKDGTSHMNSEEFMAFLQSIRNVPMREMAKRYHIGEDQAILLYICAVLVTNIKSIMQSEFLYTPGVTLTDGIAYEYAEKEKYIKPIHDFEQDIIVCAKNISKRYMGSKKRAETLEQISLTIFDSMKKQHGLGKRERLLLQIAATLHDCGKYISLIDLAECSYHIIKSTEMIGLSQMEQEIVANVVKYNHSDFPYYEGIRKDLGISEEEYLTIAKLTAILRVANGLDRSHRQKFRNIKAIVKDSELIITTVNAVDTTLERGLFKERAAFFEEVFSIKPVIRIKQKE